MPESVFTTQAPVAPDDNRTDSTLYTLSMVFRVAVPGLITAFKMFAPQNTSGTFVGVLHQLASDTTGSELARATYGPLTPGVWNSVPPITPVPVSAGPYYAIGYVTNDYYTAAPGAFASAGITSGNLSVPQSGSPYGNGRLHIGDGFPEITSSGQTNYFADVVFEAAAPSTWSYGFDVRIG